MTPALQANLFRLGEEIAAALGPEFWGRVELRIEADKLRLVDVSQRLKEDRVVGAPGAGQTDKGP